MAETTTPSPAPPPASPPTPVVEKSEKEKQADEVLKKAQDILKAHGGQESNIGLSNEYWGLMGAFRALLQEVKLEQSLPKEEKK